MALANDILSRVRRQGPGAVFTAKDFLGLGTRAAVDQSLVRLSQSDVIRRIDRGVYDLPRVHPRIGSLWPSAESVARAIARQTGSRLVGSGPRAANALGLSTQVPAHVVYLTDGPSRSVRVGNARVVLRHALPVDLLLPGTRAGATIVALRYLGRDGVSDAAVSHLSALLDDADKAQLRKVHARLPDWLRTVIDQIVAHA